LKKTLCMVGFSNAKINIGLNILEKRPDGYHNIESLFYPISWSDILEVVPASAFRFHTTGLPIPGSQENNLIYKAWNLIKPADRAVEIHLHKILPMGAGIGGGSSNGAFALNLINEVLDLGYQKESLLELASKLGSDCPFFIENRPVICLEKGNIFHDTSISLAGKYIVMVNPEIHVSTAEAYAGVIPTPSPIPLKEILENTPIENWRHVVKNDFEAGIIKKYPLIGEIKDELYANGALYASMTGSGSTVYGIFSEPLTLSFPNFIVWQGKLD
jgi:4-diphosphocytidyl-2-C-methyl-D-erythritol kinase